MSRATLNISVNEKRMMNQSEAADYTGLAAKHFKTTCPVQPVEMRPGTVVWDKIDLDKWIDSLKKRGEMTTHDAILEKLK